MKSDGLGRNLKNFFFHTIPCKRRDKRKITASEKKIKKSLVLDDSRCACCLKPFLIDRGAECNDCCAKFCKNSCGKKFENEDILLCLFCNYKRTLLKKKEDNIEIINKESPVNVTETREASDCSNTTDGNCEETNSMDNVRYIIEKFIEDLVGNVDNTPVDRLYNHPAYDELFEEYNLQLATKLSHLAISLKLCMKYKQDTDTPSMAHTALRELVERAVDEARKLPRLGESVSTKTQETTTTTTTSSTSTEPINEQSYEELLASAILNKVIEKFQTDRIDDNGIVQEDKKRKSRYSKNKSRDCSDEVDGSSDFVETSCDEYNSEWSGTRKKNLRIRQDPLSLTIEEKIEEVTTTFTPDDDDDSRDNKSNIFNFRNSRRVPFPEYGMDIIDPSQESSDESHDESNDTAPIDHITPVESWEENWLFQKKKIQNQSEPVSMLVPNPSADYRALIGDKDADDTSDLSEFSAQSDDDNDDEVDDDDVDVNKNIPASKKKILNENFSNEILIENQDKKIIKNNNDYSLSSDNNENKSLTVFHDDNQSVDDASVYYNYFDNDDNKNDNVDKKLDVELIHQTRNFLQNEIKSNKDDENNKDTLSNNQDDNTTIIIDQIDASMINKKMCHEPMTQSVSQATEKIIIDEELELSAPPRPGTIAEREHKKWENAAPIQNNPYSPENIQKRLLERQYARSSDVSGNSTNLPSSPSPPLQIVLGANRPDVKRFGRDYYINETKCHFGERVTRPGTSSSSRPASSLSLNSCSTSSDFEHQKYYETTEASSPDNQPNNIEPKIINQHIIDNERKNNKNEINAKLNNQGNFDNKKLYYNDDSNNKRKISRIDLRAYGFENEIYKSNDDIINKKKQQQKKRVINKLDLTQYGYDCGIRRTQSNNHIDSKIRNRYLINNTNNMKKKFDNYNWTQSTDTLNDNMKFNKFGGMLTAISVPNISVKSNSYNNCNKINKTFDSEDDDIKPLVVNNYNDNDINNDNINKTIKNHYNYDTDSQSSITESTDDLPPKYSMLKNIKYSFESLSGEDTFFDKNYSMPSVRRLAQAFNKPPSPIPLPASRIKSSDNKIRATTPDIQIIKTPRQMHSLTARSISREFREGLKNISNKPDAQSWNTIIIEQSRSPTGSNDIGSSEIDSGDDLCLIKNGKLKNNIKFWENIKQ
ncbi:homeobox protein 2-like isoform X2 [Aphidius gifuensis]|uniref:homeobox protein 2-like isoform X2 n=1 Tax=Aphidius gifuensis TaxID=684658 RepID=UPI001CDCB1FD|nr:homeobox protein 2-like isoform X2 [Aphidius gifuensis]